MLRDAHRYLVVPPAKVTTHEQLSQAAQNVVPVTVTADESLTKLRAWASGRCLSADQPGIYQWAGAAPAKPGRRVNRDPSNN